MCVSEIWIWRHEIFMNFFSMVKNNSVIDTRSQKSNVKKFWRIFHRYSRDSRKFIDDLHLFFKAIKYSFCKIFIKMSDFWQVWRQCTGMNTSDTSYKIRMICPRKNQNPRKCRWEETFYCFWHWFIQSTHRLVILFKKFWIKN